MAFFLRLKKVYRKKRYVLRLWAAPFLLRGGAAYFNLGGIFYGNATNV
ncbi:hypothetical protein BC792_1045 [Sphingobacterium allocomposti]|uniref:Uncharacterized protein n=1 Tax=Sphingobacterium allocomposti TaxID=415956 RepID=A0A5S5DMA9_9SPHI|nr:hypothetical protein BC792_1045 [Sphingobacterium composti Yoo et al. 2007 non Ten et al. 2007]